MIQVEDVWKTYQTGKIRLDALRGITLTIDKGDTVVLFGPSGSGKSTLLNMLGAMDKPSSGKITIDGESISGFSSSKLTDFRAKKIGFIFQNFNLIPALNVYENITVPMRLKGQKFEKKAVRDLIDRVGLSEHIRHRPDELSGGQRQRVAIARALVHNPPYVIADEPTANLDSATSLTIIELLKELNRNLGVTIIFASHDNLILEHIDTKVLLKDGLLDGRSPGAVRKETIKGEC